MRRQLLRKRTDAKEHVMARKIPRDNNINVKHLNWNLPSDVPRPSAMLPSTMMLQNACTNETSATGGRRLHHTMKVLPVTFQGTLARIARDSVPVCLDLNQQLRHLQTALNQENAVVTNYVEKMSQAGKYGLYANCVNVIIAAVHTILYLHQHEASLKP
jgi:hypothetical protein